MDNNQQEKVTKLPPVGEIDPETLNPVVSEHIRWAFASVFGESDEPQPKVPAGLRVPILDQMIGLRWACQHLIDVVEGWDVPDKYKIELLGFVIRKFLAAEKELLG